MAITESGDPKTGMITLSGVPQPDLSGVEGDLTSLQSDVLDLQSNVGDLNVSVGTLDTRVAATEPTVLLDTSAAFAANTFQTIWSKTLPAGLTGTFELSNGLISTGTAATASVVQARLFTCYRRVTGGIATVPVGSSGIQTQGITGAQIHLTVSGNDILLQLSFTSAGTYYYNFPIYLNERQI